MTDILIPKKNVIFDATVLSSLMSCSRLHDIRFNHRLISTKGKSNSLEVGSLIHKVLEVYYWHKINGFPRTTAIGNALAAGQLFVVGCPHCTNFLPANHEDSKPSCNHQPEEYPGMTNTPEHNERFTIGWRFALQTCEQYFKFYENDSFIPLTVEEVRGEVIYEDDEIRVMWKAKFDLIIDTSDVGIISMDHKTFKQRRDKTTLNNQFTGHCVLLNSRRVMVNKIGLQTTLKIEERLTREIVSYSAARLHEWQSEIVPYYAYKYIQYAESGYWPPNFTHCDTMYGPCPYKQVCEADPAMREEVLRNEYTLAPVWDPRNKEVE
jgi:PD-(D/E)XK nuclease superfamily